MKFRMGNIEFYPDKALAKEDFERLKTLLNRPSLTEDEERELTDLKRSAIKKHLQLVEAGLDSALSGQEPSPEVDELVETLAGCGNTTARLRMLSRFRDFCD